MGWASSYIAKLIEGETVTFRPRGTSMSGIIESGEQVTVRPVSLEDEIKKGDVVLCKVKGDHYLHLVKGVRSDSYLIGNNKGRINGWTARSRIYGKLERKK